MPLEKQQVEQFSRLARLKNPPSEIEPLTFELTRILDYIETLRRIEP
ncbi:MAG: hypothetical protein KAW46_07475 [candidate division Zixibacteria bacterium]|nr:hypothetical protein [candidate division Zixibacteria bacterium]